MRYLMLLFLALVFCSPALCQEKPFVVPIPITLIRSKLCQNFDFDYNKLAGTEWAGLEYPRKILIEPDNYPKKLKIKFKNSSNQNNELIANWTSESEGEQEFTVGCFSKFALGKRNLELGDNKIVEELILFRVFSTELLIEVCRPKKPLPPGIIDPAPYFTKNRTVLGSLIHESVSSIDGSVSYAVLKGN